MKQENGTRGFRESIATFSSEESDQAILQAVHNIQYGSVEVTIHESKVVQIDCNEKIRLPIAGNKKAG